MTTRNRPPSNRDRRPAGGRPSKPSRPAKGRPDSREPRGAERETKDGRRERTGDRAAAGREGPQRSFAGRKAGGGKFFGSRSEDRKSSAERYAAGGASPGRRSADRDAPEGRGGEGKRVSRPSSQRSHTFRAREDAPAERSFRSRPPRDADSRKPDSRRSDGGKPGRFKSDDRKSQDRKQQGKPYGRKPDDRRPARAGGGRPDRDRPDRNRHRDKPDVRSQERPIETPRAIVEPIPPEQLSAAVQTVVVTPDETDMRVDRFLEARFPGLSFSHIQRVIRKGQLRVDGKRVEPKDRLEAGQSVRIPPLRLDPEKPRPEGGKDDETREFLKSITLYDDDDVMVLNKPAGLAVQGGSGTTRHIDGMLGVIRTKDGQRPRLVHRLDKDTAGCLLIAKSRFAAAALAKTFRSRSARKIYWALVPGVPKPKQGRISTFLAKEEREDDSVMRVAEHGEEGASHAITYYAVVETAAARLAWLSLKPVTGRTHQLRVQLAHIGHPIVGDPKYFNIENWQLPGGIQNRLHLLARRIAVPHPRGGTIDATAPLPSHMQQSWNLLGLDGSRYDPIEDAPEG